MNNVNDLTGKTHSDVVGVDVVGARHLWVCFPDDHTGGVDWRENLIYCEQNDRSTYKLITTTTTTSNNYYTYYYLLLLILT